MTLRERSSGDTEQPVETHRTDAILKRLYAYLVRVDCKSDVNCQAMSFRSRVRTRRHSRGYPLLLSNETLKTPSTDRLRQDDEFIILLRIKKVYDIF